MCNIRMARCVLLLLALTLVGYSGESDIRKPLTLEVSKKQTVLSKIPSQLSMTMACDASSNIYFGASIETADDALVKYDAAANSIVKPDYFAPELNDLRISSVKFSVTPGGDLYVPGMALRGKEKGWYIVHFDSKGAFRSKLRLQGTFVLIHFGVFTSGEILVIGKNSKDDRLPKGYFTSIFDNSGRFVRLVDLKDDPKTNEKLEAKDSQYVNTSGPVVINRTIELGHVLSGGDGFVYVLRRTSPAKIFAISATGEVERTLSIQSNDRFPSGFQFSNGYFAVRLHNPEKPSTGLFKVIASSTGEELYTIDASNVSAAFACFESPATFKVLTANQGALTLETLSLKQ